MGHVKEAIILTVNRAGPPVYYDYKNAATAVITPSTVHVQNTALAAFFRRYLMQLAMSVYKWEMPDHWDADYFKAVLYSYGYIGVINTDKFGVIPQQCGLGGYNVFYRPTEILIANPYIHVTRNPVINKNCVVVRFQNDYRGILDLVSYYSNQMAIAADTISVNLLNSKLSYAFAAHNKASAETLKKAYDQMASGNPMVVYDSRIKQANAGPLWEFFSQNVGQNYIADRVLADMTRLENQFKTIIGIPNANTEKRERVNTLEITSNDVATQSRAAEWLQRLQYGCQQVRDMFNVEVSVDWRFPPAIVNGGEVGATYESDD